MDQAIDLSIRSTPGLRRPVGRLKSLRESLKIARPVITSCDREALVGIARTLTDFTDVASLAGLAVDLVYQKKRNRKGASPKNTTLSGVFVHACTDCGPGRRFLLCGLGFASNPGGTGFERGVRPETFVIFHIR
ncbi:MAG: putative acetyltransferase [Leptospirillum sp. Group II 'C75']|nr:MAG: putative acetyltransferase [Leptospirillum sp. Group II 'C75']